MSRNKTTVTIGIDPSTTCCGIAIYVNGKPIGTQALKFSDRYDYVKLKNISYILLISVAFLSLVSFLIDYRFSAGYVIKQENKLIESMSSYKKLGTQVFLLNDRLSHLNQLIVSRKSFKEG